MDISVATLLLTLATLLASVGESFADSFPACGNGRFYNHDLQNCVPCSRCDANKVAFRQCYGDRDTVCGTLGKFEFRQTGPATKDEEKPVSDQLPSTPTSQHTDATVLYAVDKNDRKWFTITIILVTVFVIVCIAVVVVLFVVCLMCRKKQREIVCNSVLSTNLLKDGTPIRSRPNVYAAEQFRLVTET